VPEVAVSTFFSGGGFSNYVRFTFLVHFIALLSFVDTSFPGLHINKLLCKLIWIPCRKEHMLAFSTRS
jgi:hypothetical protein